MGGGANSSTDDRSSTAAVGTEPAQPRFDHRLSGETGVLDGVADKHKAEPGLTSAFEHAALLPCRRQDERWGTRL